MWIEDDFCNYPSLHPSTLLIFCKYKFFFSHKYFLIGNYLKSLVKYCFVYFECKDENPTHNNCKWDNLSW